MSRVLPKLLPLFLRPSQQIRQQLMLICNHVNKRLKAIPNMRLPVDALVQLYQQHATDRNGSSAFLMTFLLMYIEKGFARLSASERAALCHQLLSGLSHRAPMQQRTLLHTFFQAMDPSQYRWETLGVEEHERRFGELKKNRADQQVMLNFILDVMLWTPAGVNVAAKPTATAPAQPQSQSQPSSPPPAPASSSSPSPPSVAAESPVPEGLSRAAVGSITQDGKLSSSQMQQLKARCLHFLANADVFTANDMLPAALAGSCAGSSEVVHVAEGVVKRLQLNLEEVELIKQLFAMYHGTMEEPDVDKRRKPVGYQLKVKILHYLSKSRLSVNLIQPALKLIMDTLFSPTSTHKLKDLGLLYTNFLLNNQTNPQHTHTIAQVLLNAMLRFLATIPAQSSTASEAASSQGIELVKQQQTSTSVMLSQLRGQCYQLIGQIALRRPDLVNKDLRMLQLFFKALNDESNDIAIQNVHEGLSMLRSAYVGVDANVQMQLQHVLLTLMVQADRRVRLNALQCLNRLFPFQDVLARYVDVFNSNDAAIEIRDECQRGLTPFVVRNELEVAREQQRVKREREERERKEKKKKEDAANAEEKKEDESAMVDVGEPVSPTSPSPSPAVSTAALLSARDPSLPIEAARVPYPPFSELVAFAHAHILAPKDPSVATSGSDLASSRFSQSQQSQLRWLRTNLGFDIRALPRLLDFLADTFTQNALYTIKRKPKEKEEAKSPTAAAASSSSSSTAPSDTTETASTALTEEEMDEILATYAEQLLSSEESSGVPPHSRSLLLFQALIEHALEQRVHDVQANAAGHLVRLVKLRPALFAPVYAARLPWLEGNMVSGIHLLRTAMGDLLHILAPSLQPDEIVLGMMQRFNTQLLASDKIVGPSRDDVAHGCVLALGVLVGEGMRRNKLLGFGGVDNPWSAEPFFPLSLMESIVIQLTRRLDAATFNRTPHITAATVISIGRMGEVANIPIPKTDAEAAPAATSSTGPISRAGLVQTLFSMLRGSERKSERVMEESVRALALMCLGDRDPDLLNQVINGFFEAVTSKFEEIHFAIGEGLSIICKNHQFPLPTSAVASSMSLTGASSTSSSGQHVVIQPGQDVLYTILPRLFRLIAHGSSVQRSASCIWLLSLVKFLPKHPALKFFFAQIQASFTVALTDSNQLVQEVAAKGMAILYEHSSGEMQQQLIDALTQTFSMGQRKVTGDTLIELDAEKGEYSTYRELVDVARSMNRQDLVYNFLDLASHHSIWSSKLGAAFSLSSIVQVNKKLSSQLGSILPKLYRYQFDPNAKIQAAMKQMWLSLVANPREAINQHFDAIITDLVDNMPSRQYRVRQSSCLALVELLHGRGMDQLGPHLEKVWSYTFRLLDDVNGEVRKAATSLAQALTHISVRLCDPQYSSRANAQQAMDIVLPVLLNQGVQAKAKEIQSVSIRAVLSLVKIGGQNLRPHLPLLIGTLMESMSNMEPAVFSYLQQHAGSMQMSEEQIERARLQMASSGVLAEALSSCLMVVDETSVPGIVAKLSDIIGTGLGLPTLTAASKFIVSMVQSKTTVASAMREHASPLIQQLLQGLTDQSPTLRKYYADALGYLCRIAKKKRVEKVMASLSDMYLSDRSTNTSRLISGFALRSIARQAPDVVRKEFMSELVPLAFLATHDNTAGHPEIKNVWNEVFEELLPGGDSAVPLYMRECAAFARKEIESPVYVLRHIALLTIKHLILVCKLRFESELSATLPLLINVLPGRLWQGKEVALDALAFLSQECGSRMSEEQIIQTLGAVCAECKRNKTEYKREAIRCMGKVAACFPFISDQHTIEPMKELLQPILDLSATSSSTGEREVASMDDEKEKGPNLLLITYTYGCLGDLFPSPQDAINGLYVLQRQQQEQKMEDIPSDQTAAPPTSSPLSSSASSSIASSSSTPAWYDSQHRHLEWMLTSLLPGLEKGYAWSVRVAILHSLKRVVDNVYGGESLAPTTAGSVVESRSFGPSLIRESDVAQLVSGLLRPNALAEAKIPAVRAKAIEVVQKMADRQTAWSALLSSSNRSVAQRLNDQLLSMRSDLDATVLRLTPAIQTKLARDLAQNPASST